MTKEEIAKEYLQKMGIAADTLLTLDETLHILKTKAPMPYFKYNAAEMMPSFFKKNHARYCIGQDFANCLAERFMLISKRATHEKEMERKALRRHRNYRN